MRIVFTLFFCSCLFLRAGTLFGQEVSLRGKISDAANNAPLPGASVQIKGGSTGTTSSVNGDYQITAPSKESIVVISLIGYKTVEEKIGDRQRFDVKLQPDNQQLGEVVVTALGISREKKSLGYSAQSVNSEDLNKNLQPNMVNALQGKVAGVTISSTGGAPGQGANIQIRGINSIDPNSNNQPLFVIDGVQIDNTTSNLGAGSELRGMSNRAADINPNDIETINVLKGGAATALYGLRGANGVVVITTKSGKGGALRVNFTSTAGFDEVNKIPEIQDRFSQGTMGVYNPQDFFPSWGPTVAEARAIDPTHPAKLYNHFKDAYQSGSQFRNDLTLSGGSEKVTFLSSLSQLNQKGTIPFTNYQNLQARVNTQVKFSKKFNTGISLNFINSGGNRYNADRFSESLSYWSPRWDVTDFIKPDGTMKTYGNNNPIYGAYTNRLKDNVNRLVGGINFSYDPFSWLNVAYRAGVDTYSENRLRTAPGPRGFADEFVLEDNGQGFVYNYNTNARTINSSFIVTGKAKLAEKLNGSLRLGHELYDRRIKDVGVLGDTLTVYNQFDIRNAKSIRGTQNLAEYRLMGIFGEMVLDYDNYLFLTLTGRNDITSSLARGNNSFFYPSASLAYTFSEHLKLPQAITNAKLRLSYAQIGKDAREYATSNGFAIYQGLPTGYTGFTRASLLGNPDLKPEFTNTYEAGLEMSFLNNLITLDFSYYYSLSKDQIIQVAVSSATGYSTASVNSGEMRNRGIELALTANPIRNDHFSWQSSLNFSANRNKILSIREDLQEIPIASQFGYSGSDVTMRLIPGQAYGTLYGSYYSRLGADPNSATIDKSKPVIIGANGFPVREPVSQQKILGNSLPKWIAGFNNTVSYKNFSLNALIDARFGQDKYNQMDNFFAAFGIAKYTEDRDQFRVFDGVLADGTPNTKSVWLGQGVGPDNVNYTNGYYRNVYRTVSENFIEDASWVRLRSASLSYNLPAKWLGNGIIKNLRVSVTGNNLFLITKYKGYDPETSSYTANSTATPGGNIDGFSGFTYPALRSYLFTLNVGF